MSYLRPSLSRSTLELFAGFDHDILSNIVDLTRGHGFELYLSIADEGLMPGQRPRTIFTCR